MPKTDNEPATGMAMPVMRGFPCHVTTPFMGSEAGPEQGVGCGWSKVGEEPMFSITIHAEGGFAMIASFDAEGYTRFAENYAAMGRQALLQKDETE